MATFQSTLLPHEPAERIPLVKTLVATIAAAVAVALINSIVFIIGDAAGTFPTDVTFESWNGEEMAIGLSNVISMCVMAMVAAGIVFAILTRVSSRPVRMFSWIAVVVFALSLFTPFSIPDAPGDMIAVLLLMHVLAAGIGVWVLTRVATR